MRQTAIEIPRCPTCWRRPSERRRAGDGFVREIQRCDDPIHALADAGPAAVALLREVLLSADASWEEQHGGHDWPDVCKKIRAMLAALPAQPEEPKP